MYCIYRTTEVSHNTLGRSYLSRMNETMTDQSLLADGCAYVTATDDGHYAIANSDNEILYIGNNGIVGMQQQFDQIRPTKILVNGVDFESYRKVHGSLVYFVFIRKSADRCTYFVAIEQTREGHTQGVQAFTGTLEDVERSVSHVLGQSSGQYYLHYVNEAYRLPTIPEQQLPKDVTHDPTLIRAALRPHISKWKEKQSNAA